MKYLVLVFLLLSGIAYAADTNTTVSSTVTGTTTVDKTPSTANAPNVMISNQDVCTSGGSVALQTQIFGFAKGSTVTDITCERLKLSRALYAMGMKVAGVSVLCQDPRVFQAMEMAGTPCPYFGTIGEVAQAGWDSHPKDRPDYVKESNAKNYIVGGVILAITTGIFIF
tara:strand:+ start:403 stop:909 length:507 start_codon:yes stop_codon:yes gene_type:complete